MKSRLIIWLSLWVMLSMLLNGCSSSVLSASNARTYNEKISHYLITNDGQKMVFLGEFYHYSFTITPGLKNVLTGAYRQGLKDQLAYIKSETFDGLISGQYTLVCDCRDAGYAQISWLKAHGFEYAIDSQLGYIKSSHLKGWRILPSRLNLDDHEIFALSDELVVIVEKVPTLRRVRDRSVMDKILSMPSLSTPVGGF